MSVSFSKLAKKRWVAAAVASIGLLAWVVVGFFGAQVLVLFGWPVLASIVPAIDTLSETVTQFILTALVYLFTLIIVIGGVFLLRQRITKAELGVDKAPSWLDVLLAPAIFVGYLIVSSLVVLAASNLVPGFDVQQTQEIGFNNIAGQADLFVVFIALVVVAPIAEEVLFRGYLYGKLRSYTGIIVATLLTSALFGAVHLQWNVAVDTFILSLAMCGLREITGSIWAGTLVHMLKNGLAFFLIFIYPIITV